MVVVLEEGNCTLCLWTRGGDGGGRMVLFWLEIIRDCARMVPSLNITCQQKLEVLY